MAEECRAGDFLEWLGPDISTTRIFSRLDDPADLVRAAAVSRTWRRFGEQFASSSPMAVDCTCHRRVLEFPHLCSDREQPEQKPVRAAMPRGRHHRCHGSGSHIAATAAVAISLPSAPAPESDSERDYRIYSNVARALVSNSGDRSVGCVLRCVGASSTDNFPFETMVHTLDEHELVNFRPSYWSSCGADDPEEPESLTYRLNSDVCIVDEIRVQPFLAYFQYGQPIYSSKTVRFRMGHYKLPRGSESFVTNEDENKMVNADNKYMWTYTSPEFPMLQENVLQSFKLPCPVLCIGGVVMIELLGRVQKQEADNKYYICICHVEVIGRSLFTTFHG